MKVYIWKLSYDGTICQIAESLEMARLSAIEFIAQEYSPELSSITECLINAIVKYEPDEILEVISKPTIIVLY